MSHFQGSPIEVSEASCSQRQKVAGVIPGNLVSKALREIEDGPFGCESESKLVISSEPLQRFLSLSFYKAVVDSRGISAELPTSDAFRPCRSGLRTGTDDRGRRYGHPVTETSCRSVYERCTENDF